MIIMETKHFYGKKEQSWQIFRQICGNFFCGKFLQRITQETGKKDYETVMFEYLKGLRRTNR